MNMRAQMKRFPRRLTHERQYGRGGVIDKVQ